MDPCVYVIYTETVPELNFYRNSDPDPFEIKLLDFSVKSYPKKHKFRFRTLFSV